MSPANLAGFFLNLVLNPLFWLFIVFWIIYAATKKRWAKITAIVFTAIGLLTFVATCYVSFGQDSVPPETVDIKNVYVSESLAGEGVFEDKRVFSGRTNDIYLSVEVQNITPEDELKVIWTFLETGNIIEEQISSVDQAGSGDINFNIHIAEGFPEGNYKADVYLNGILKENLSFSVR